MLPYIEAPPIALGPLRIYPFGLLVVAGIVTGIWLLRRRAARVGLDADVALGLAAAAVLCGLVGAHVLRLIFFEPDLLRADPAALVDFRKGGIYSFGGLAAGATGAYLYMRAMRLNTANKWAHFDAVAFVFPVAWTFGRAGCAVAHDHPGVRADNWLSVNFPGGPRYDLGLIECLFTLLVVAWFAWLDRRPRARGFYLGVVLVTFGLFRMWLDTLHESAGGPDRWWGLAAAVVGVAVLRFRAG